MVKLYVETLFAGIDPGSIDGKTTGICFLKKNSNFHLQTGVIAGKYIQRFLSAKKGKITVTAIKSPAQIGHGKGDMRLWEKYLSQKAFKKRGLSALPPSFVPKVMATGIIARDYLADHGLVENKTIIETHYPLLEKVLKKTVIDKFKPKRKTFRSEHEYQAYLCSIIAYLHNNKETFWIGYKDGLMFLPKPKYWYKKSWDFFNYQWHKKHIFRYKYLKTNLKSLKF